jgi:hypothetical protein
MKIHTKLLLGGIALLVIPPLIMAAEIMRQLSLMDPPSAAHLDLRWFFIAFYAMAGGIITLIFARGRKKRYLAEEAHRKLKESRETDSK